MPEKPFCRVAHLKVSLSADRNDGFCMSAVDPVCSLQILCVESLTPNVAVFGERK